MHSLHTMYLRVPRISSTDLDNFCIQYQTICISNRYDHCYLQQQNLKSLNFLFNIKSKKLRKSEIWLEFQLLPDSKHISFHL
jgi:hypothetical protein